MSLVTLLTFGAAMFLLAASPGPGVFATVVCALGSGFSHAAIVVFGIVIGGDLTFLLLAIYGLSSMAEFFGGLFTCIRYAGGVYLIWLGLGIWRAPTDATEITRTRELSWKKTSLVG